MATTARTPKRLSDEDLARVLELAKQSDSVELKLTVPGVRPALERSRRSSWILSRRRFARCSSSTRRSSRSTPRAWSCGRGRIQGKGDDSVVKLRPVVPDELPDEPAQVAQPRRRGRRDARRLRVLGDVERQDGRPRRQARRCRTSTRSASSSRRSSARSSPSTRRTGVELDELTVLGPIFVLKLKFRPAELRPPARRGAVALPRRLADPRALDEVHRRRRVPGRGRVAGVPHRAGHRPLRRAADEDEDRARVLLDRSSRRRTRAPAKRSISASSSSPKSSRSSAATLSSSWATLDAPISVEFTRASRSVHASAIWASVCPRRSAIPFSARIRSKTAPESRSGRGELGRVAREPSGIPFRYLSVSIPCASGEDDAAHTELADGIEQVGLDRAVQHRIGGLMDEEWRPELAEDRRGLAGLLGRVRGDPGVQGLPARTAESSAPIVSSTGVSGSKRCE